MLPVLSHLPATVDMWLVQTALGVEDAVPKNVNVIIFIWSTS